VANEWKLYDAEVTEVLEWAKDRSRTNDYVIEVATHQVGDSAKLLRLFGNDPSELFVINLGQSAGVATMRR
jgi:hypothetical protein